MQQLNDANIGKKPEFESESVEGTCIDLNLWALTRARESESAHCDK